VAAVQSRHLLLLNLALFALVWILHGELVLRGYGELYAERARDFFLEGDDDLFDTTPGIENVLLPGLAAALSTAWRAAGGEFTDAAFVVCSIVPYPLFIYAVTRYVRRHCHGGALLALGAAVALYTSGMIPYMTSWGGYVDGLGYLLMVPVFLRPESLLVYVVTFILQCANHYLGAFALLLFACVWHSMRGLERSDASGAARYWLTNVSSRLALSLAILAAFMWYWQTAYPTAAGARVAIMAARWAQPGAVVQEVLGWFPWTLLSTVKLVVVPIAALMAAELPRRRWRSLVLGLPFLAATALTLLFSDVTRVATMAVIPVLLVTIRAAGSDATPPHVRRRLRRLLVAAALLNLLIPNYYVNNGNILVPLPHDTTALIRTLAESLRE